MRKSLKPGSKAPASGQFAIVNRLGNRTPVERTVVLGETLPPTPKAGQSYVLVDRTKNASGRKR